MKATLLTLAVLIGCFHAIAPAESPPAHPDSTGEGWQDLFAADLSNASFPEGVWTVTDGVLTASEDRCLFTNEQYEDFTLDLEFKTADGTNSGVIIYCSDRAKWIPNSLEIQIADDFAGKWAKSPKTWQCAAVFGRLAPTRSAVRKPGEWNRMTIACKGRQVDVVLNGEAVTSMDMGQWTEVSKNPDGSDIPGWLNKPAATLATKGYIGLQGKHAGAPIFFRNIRIREH